MNVEEFLTGDVEERLKAVDKNLWNEAARDSKKMSKDEWVNAYSQRLMDAGVSVDKFRKLTKSTKDLSTRLRESFGDVKFNPSERWKKRVYLEEFQDVPKDKFEEGLSKMKSYYDQNIAEKEAEFGRKKRENEVKKWGWRDLLSSEYEKQRYIDDPNSAIFGKEAPGFLGSSAGAKADLVLGALGAAGDVAPGWWSMSGPVIRGVRDAGHIALNSPYQKTKEQAVNDFAKDAIFNASTAWLPNFRKEKRMLEGSKGNVGKILSLENEAKNIDDAFGDIAYYLQDETLSTSDKIRSLRNAYLTMPESELKTKVGEILNRRDLGLADLDEIRRLGAEYDMYGSYAATPVGRRMFKRDYGGNENIEHIFKGEVRPVTEFTPFTRRILEAPELTKFEEKIKKPMLNLASKGITSENISNAAKNLGHTVTGRGKSPDRVETPEERAQIEEIKNQEARFWEAGFKPHKNENDLLWKAYVEWDEKNKRGED